MNKSLLPQNLLSRQRGDRPATPEGLADLVEYILSGRVGSNRAITLGQLRQQVQGNPIYKATNSRQVRSAIEDLRVRGRLICNDLAGEGYYTAGNIQEYQSFRSVYMSYATTILARVRRMDEEAQKRFKADALQERLL
ncbi:MAG: hypothetical protein D4R70_00115 [Betaproteobacteria bacterium]|nr:MAG: hypothetical protein D4R70_00115 [Betaproteobacteria bacterium]